MKSVTVELDGTTREYESIGAFCKDIGINHSTFINMIKNNRCSMTNKTKALENMLITIHDDDDRFEETKYAFGVYEKKDYNRSHTCECGVTHYFRDRERHKKSKRHINWASSSGHDI